MPPPIIQRLETEIYIFFPSEVMRRDSAVLSIKRLFCFNRFKLRLINMKLFVFLFGSTSTCERAVVTVLVIIEMEALIYRIL
jgi:hypothetical protein